MRRSFVLGSSLAAALLIAGPVAAEELKSGPPVGSSKIGAFHPLNVTGSAAGKKQCLV